VRPSRFPGHGTTAIDRQRSAIPRRVGEHREGWQPPPRKDKDAMSTTLETAPITPTTSTRGGALRYYRLAVLVLGLALAAMIAATVYLAVHTTPTATPYGQTTASDVCFRPAVPC